MSTHETLDAYERSVREVRRRACHQFTSHDELRRHVRTLAEAVDALIAVARDHERVVGPYRKLGPGGATQIGQGPVLQCEGPHVWRKDTAPRCVYCGVSR